VKSIQRNRQRGAVLIALAALFTLGTLWAVVSRRDAASANLDAAKRARNAIVLNRAKQALIGHVAAQAVRSDEQDPGALPCPEAPASFNSTSGTDGKAAGSCTLPKVGRFPWRTVGTEPLLDAHAEPLWYVVSPGWGYTSANARPSINADSEGQLTVDGRANAAIALIIAPGPAIRVSAAAGCSAWSQTRPASGPPDLRNYLECQNATNPPDAAFVTQGAAGSFNDQVVLVTAADLMPVLEAAIAKRVETDIAPLIKSAYSGTAWGGKPFLPFAADFGNPATASYRGVAGTLEGWMPVSYATAGPCTPAGGSATCTPEPCATGADSRCDPLFVAWQDTPLPFVSRTGGAALASQVCHASTAAAINCTLAIYSAKGSASEPMSFDLVARARNVAMALRVFNTAVDMAGIAAMPRGVSGAFNSDGSATVTLRASVAGGAASLTSPSDCMAAAGFAPALHDCFSTAIRVPIALLDDHPAIQPRHPTLGWFSRNRWHALTYYAVAAGHAVTVLPASPACASNSGCLSVANVSPAGGLRALLVLAGRRIGGATRPSAERTDYFELGNAVSAFEQQPARRGASRPPFNDRIVVVDAN